MANGTVGVVGLGIMGGAMARNLVASGFDVVGFDTDDARAAELQNDGIEIAGSASQVAQRSHVLITSLPNPAALIATARSLAVAALDRTIVIDTSTLALEDKQSAYDLLDEAGHVLLDSPVSGTGAQARSRDLVVYASGDTRAIETARPVFDAIARDTHNVGVFGNGSRMKFVANLLVTVHNVASAEAMVLGMKAGLDPERIVEVIGAGIGTSRIFDVRAPMMAKGEYQPPTAHLATAHKDLKIIADFADRLGCPTPMMSASAPVYDAAMAQGLAKQDSASICELLERQAGVKRQDTN
jgi:3-hydroxyisobutyrate dehydrogenase-like beta-hydroxyacid dehydrogenase